MRCGIGWVLPVAMAVLGCVGGTGREAMSPEDVAGINRACAIGRLLFLHDLAAAKATDTMAAAGINPREFEATGYLAMLEGDEARVGWIRDDDSGLRVVAQVRLGDFPFRNPVAEKVDSPVRLGAEDTRRWKALGLVKKRKDLGLCSMPYNPVVLPASMDGQKGYYVYLLANTTRSHTQVTGGHVRVHVKDLDSGAGEVTHLSQCMEMELEPGEEKSVAAIGLATPLVERPVETHYYTSILYRMPLYLETVQNMRVWKVNGPACAGFTPRGAKKGQRHDR